METKKVKQCRLCAGPIYLKKDSYMRLTDYKEGQKFDEGFYHITCYRKFLKGISNQDTKQAKEMLSRVSGWMDQLGIPKATKEFVVTNAK